MARLTTIMARGTSAHEQLAVYRAARDDGATRVEALRRVVDWLVAATVPRVSAIDAADEGVDDATETTDTFVPPAARGLVAPEAASALA
jgi:carboxylate-amine ligase